MKTRFIHFLNQAMVTSTLLAGPIAGHSQKNPAITEDMITTPPGFDIKDRSFVLPQVQPKWKYSQSISFSYILLPQQWTLNQLNAPMLNYSGKFSLPAGFQWQVSLSTIIISNQLEFGPAWNYSFGHYHLGLGWHAGYSLGFLNQSGFDSHMSGWDQEPFLAIGHDFKKISLTLKGIVQWINTLSYSEGGHTLTPPQSFFNGYSISGSIEHRLYRNKVVQFTAKLNSMQYYFLAWPLFPASQSRYLMPEFTIGLNF